MIASPFLPRLALGLLVLSGVAPGCSAPPPPARPAVTAPEPRRASVAEVLAGSREKGATLTLVNAWATFCAPCREEMPDLVRVREAFAGRGVEVALLNVEPGVPPRVLARWLSQWGVDFPTWQQAEGNEAFSEALDPSWEGYLPYTVVFDAEGRIVHRHVGRKDFAGFRELLEPLLD